MQGIEQEAQMGGMGLNDIYYILFRHKWKIISISAVGVIAAVGLLLFKSKTYRSEAKLYVRYVQDAKLPTGTGDAAQIRSADPSGYNIINSEAEILTSMDLALQVADTVGPEKIVGKGKGAKDRYHAATVIRDNLSIENPSKTDILKVSFQHPDPDVVQTVLDKVLQVYQKKHIEIHRTPEMIDNALARRTDDARAALQATENDLKKLKKQTGFVNLEETKKSTSTQFTHLQQQILDGEAEFAQGAAVITNLQKSMPGKTDEAAAADSQVPPPEIVNEYKMLTQRLDSFRKREEELMAQFSDENVLLKSIRKQIGESEKYRTKLLLDYPKLETVAPVAGRPVEPAVDIEGERARLTALKAKIETLRTQLTNVTAQIAAINEAEPAILELERRQKLEEAQYNYYYSNLQQARFDATMMEGKLANIAVAEAATPPFYDTAKVLKQPMMIVLGSIIGAFALVFFIEFYADQTIRRAVEIETRLRLPLFLTIPDEAELNGKQNGRLQLKAPAEDGTTTVQLNGSLAVAPWDEGHGLRPYCEALRDRLVTYFEVRNLTHKPKLVAVTACGAGAGVTTLAAGLAATLSETGDGNVLLVDMNVQNGAAHPFFKGKPGCALADALEDEKRDDGMVNENLYVASAGRNANGDKLPRILPKRFSQLMPKLKGSDYDYIIFDMPPVSQTSVTARLATYMDMTLLVVESEKTNRDVVKRATALLGESKANVTAILNKTRNYVPRALQQET